MLYVYDHLREALKDRVKVIDNNTNTVIVCRKDELEELCKDFKDVVHYKSRDIDSRYRVIARIEGIDSTNYKIYSTVSNSIIYVEEKELSELHNVKSVIDNYIEDSDSYYDYINIVNNKDFEIDIHKKYQKFKAKAKLMGYNIHLGYRIEGDNVILTSINADGDTLIIPEFITSLSAKLMHGEDKLENVNKVIVGSGVKFIGYKALDSSAIKRIDIKDEIEYIFDDEYNTKLNKDNINIIKLGRFTKYKGF